MRKYTAIAAAAAMALTGFSFTTARADEKTNEVQAPNVSPENDVAGKNSQQRQNINRGDQAADIQGVRTLLSDATNDAFQEHGLRQFRSLFQSPNSAINRADNQARSGISGGAGAQGQAEGTGALPESEKSGAAASGSNDQHKADMEAFNQKVAQFRSDWKAKYNQDFHIGDAAVVYADITSNELMSGQPRTAGAELSGSSAASGSSTNSNPSPNGTNASATDRQNADHVTNSSTQQPGRTLGADQGTAAMQGDHFTLNAPAYKIAKPVSVDLVRTANNEYRFAEQPGFNHHDLRQNLSRQIDAVEDHKDNWPSDVNEAYRLVSQHVLMAVADTQNGGSAQPASGELRGSGNSSDSTNGATIHSNSDSSTNTPSGVNK